MSTHEGAPVNHMRIPQTTPALKGHKKQAKSSNAIPANARHLLFKVWIYFYFPVDSVVCFVNTYQFVQQIVLATLQQLDTEY